MAGLALRVRASGARSYVLTYRPGVGGRRTPSRKITLGEAGALALGEARRVAKAKLGEIAQGLDPAAERRKARRLERTRLAGAIDRL